MVLWSDVKDDYTNDIRWKLFLTSIHPTLKKTEWQSLDEELLFTTLSVYYLFVIMITVIVLFWWVLNPPLLLIVTEIGY